MKWFRQLREMTSSPHTMLTNDEVEQLLDGAAVKMSICLVINKKKTLERNKVYVLRNFGTGVGLLHWENCTELQRGRYEIRHCVISTMRNIKSPRNYDTATWILICGFMIRSHFSGTDSASDCLLRVTLRSTGDCTAVSLVWWQISYLTTTRFTTKYI